MAVVTTTPQTGAPVASPTFTGTVTAPTLVTASLQAEKDGAAKICGVATFADPAVPVTVSTTAITATSLVLVTPQGGFAAYESKADRVAGTSFVIGVNDAVGDPSDGVCAWLIVEPV